MDLNRKIRILEIGSDTLLILKHIGLNDLKCDLCYVFNNDKTSSMNDRYNKCRLEHIEKYSNSLGMFIRFNNKDGHEYLCELVSSITDSKYVVNSIIYHGMSLYLSIFISRNREEIEYIPSKRYYIQR